MRLLRLVGIVMCTWAVAGCMDRDLVPIRPAPYRGDAGIEPVGSARVDIVVLVDNSGSMSEEQVALTRRFRELIAGLSNPPDDDGDTLPDSIPVDDLNIAVISSDMGTMGYRVDTCSNPDGGDDGCFQHDSSPAVGGCAAGYSPFLSRNPGNSATYTADQMAGDFSCIATLGTNGCGFEQQLKAMRKATIDNAAPGACNAGFLREDSIIAIVFVTDENDCSVDPAHPEMFDESRTDLGNLNVRCFLHSDYLESVDQYYAALRSLRADPAKIVLAMIVGVPPDAPACNNTGGLLAGCLSVPEMEERLNGDGDDIVPSCDVLPMGIAYPPVRFVRLAQMWGEDAIVSSICNPDWSAAIDAITAKLRGRLSSTCFARELEFVTDDPDDVRDCVANCRLIETYGGTDPRRPCATRPEDAGCVCPPATAGDTATAAPCRRGDGTVCEPFKRDLGCTDGDTACAGSESRRQCLVRQAVRTWDGSRCSTPVSGGEGWYYVSAGSVRNEPGCGDATPSNPCVNPPCHQLVLASGDVLFIEDGSDADLPCIGVMCPADRQCGGADQPTAGCCATDQIGTLGPGRSFGTCRPATCPPGQRPVSAVCSASGSAAGTCEPG